MSEASKSEAERLAALYRYEILDTPPEAQFDRITRLVNAVLSVPMAAVTLIDADRQWFKSKIGIDLTETPRSESFCAHTMLETGPMIVHDARQDERFRDNPQVTGGPNVQFYVGIPLHTKDGTPLGALCGFDSKPREIAPHELELLKDLASLTMEQLELGLLANQDSLTGAMSRSAFLTAANRDFTLATRSKRPLACLMIDADHFKRVNDHYGHAVGDKVLVGMVQACRNEIRRTDFIGRVGGEEFCAILPDTDEAGALTLAERLRFAIGQTVIEHEGKDVRITASIGISTLNDADITIDQLFVRADDALYKAKRDGRNRVHSEYARQAAAALT